MKKLFCIFLCCILMFSMSAVAFADDVHSSDPNAKPLGDMDFDGKVSASDAREILRGSVGLVSLIGITELYADVNQDGTVTAADARMALRASVELETLPVHNIDPEEIEFSTCSKKGYIKGTCVCCKMEFRCESPLIPHKLFPDCRPEATCEDCGAVVPVTPGAHSLADGICTVCGYLDMSGLRWYMCEYVREHGVYQEQSYCIWDENPETPFGLICDEEFEDLYIYCGFYSNDEDGNIVFLCNYYLDFSSDFEDCSLGLLALTEAEDEYIDINYSIDKKSINQNTPGALTETYRDIATDMPTPSEMEALKLSSEAVAISMLLWFDEFLAENEFGFSIADLGFTSLCE